MVYWCKFHGPAEPTWRPAQRGCRCARGGGMAQGALPRCKSLLHKAGTPAPWVGAGGFLGGVPRHVGTWHSGGGAVMQVLSSVSLELPRRNFSITLGRK